jgi:hypothetical protein
MGFPMNTVDDEPAVPPPPGLAHYTGFLLRRAYVRVLQHDQSGMPSGRHSPF